MFSKKVYKNIKNTLHDSQYGHPEIDVHLNLPEAAILNSLECTDIRHVLFHVSTYLVEVLPLRLVPIFIELLISIMLDETEFVIQTYLVYR